MSLSGHRVFETAIGMALIVLATALNFRLLPWAVTVGLGAIMATLGLAATREGRKLTGTAHRGVDAIVAALTALAAIALGLAGEGEPAIVLALAAAGQGALALVTRYVERDRVRG